MDSSSDRGFSDYLHTAAPSSAQQHATGAGKKPPSAGEALSSAKILLDAAISKLHKTEGEADNGNGNQFDKAKVAAAAAGVLAAAQHYGKMDEKKYGKYVEKAHDYLNKFGNSSQHSSSPPPPSHSASPRPSSHFSASSEGMNYEKYLKKAEEFLNKRKQ